MLDKKIEESLNRQINFEFAAAHNYLAMAAHFERVNLLGFAGWMQQQREEEVVHAMRLFQYVNDRGGSVRLGAIEEPPYEFESTRAVFLKSLEMEQDNTRAINDLYSLATDLKDFATMSHLQWFLDEQVEEEKIMNEVIAKIDLAGHDRAALLVLNQELGNRQPEK